MTNASPPSSLVDVGQLAAALERFAAERNWAQFHSPKNLVMALTGEVGELSEIFQWMDEEQSKDAARHPDTAQAVQDELADVLMYLVRLASVHEHANGSERIVYPHSLIRAPRRRHIRAWCEEKKSFRDFTLGRIAVAEPLDTPAPYRRDDDQEWNNILELVIVAHPGLSPDQQEMIAAENFPGARARRLKVRQCLASYIIQDLRLALDPVKHPTPEYQLMVGNADKLPPLFVSGS